MWKNIVLKNILFYFWVKIIPFMLMHKGNEYSQIFLLYLGAIRLIRSLISSGSNVFWFYFYYNNFRI